MHFYFQTGEFLGADSSNWFDLFVQFLGIVVGAGVAILVFWLGKRNDEKKAVQRLNDLEVYLAAAINSLDEPVKKQIASLDQFSKELAKPRDVHYAPQTIVSLHSKSIRWISHEDLHKILVLKRTNVPSNSERFRRFNADLDFIDSNTTSLEAIMQLFMSKKEKYVEDYNSSMKQISKLKDSIYHEYTLIKKEKADYKDEYFHSLDKLMYDWSQKQDYMEHDVSKKEFLLPLQKLSREAQVGHNQLQVLESTGDALFALDNLDSLKSFIKDSVDFQSKRLKEVETNLDSLSKHYWKQ